MSVYCVVEKINLGNMTMSVIMQIQILSFQSSVMTPSTALMMMMIMI